MPGGGRLTAGAPAGAAPCCALRTPVSTRGARPTITTVMSLRMVVLSSGRTSSSAHVSTAGTIRPPDGKREEFPSAQDANHVRARDDEILVGLEIPDEHGGI